MLPIGLAQAAVPTVTQLPVVVSNQPSAVQAHFDQQVATIQPPHLTIQLTESEYQAQLKQRRLASAKLASVPVASTPSDVSRDEKLSWAQKAAAQFGIDWKLLAAVWQVESGQTWQGGRSSYAGAQGPCQFMPGTWRKYAVDGNGDGQKSIADARDCLFGAAQLLAANGANSGNNTKALLAYNHSMSYVSLVSRIAGTF